MEIKLGKNIKYLREAKKMEQQELADKLNIPRSTLSCWENNLRTPKLEQIVKIAEFFKTDLSIIYDDLQLKTTYEPTDDDLKNVLKEKGLIDESDEISEEDFNKLIEFAMANKDFIIKKENK